MENIKEINNENSQELSKEEKEEIDKEMNYAVIKQRIKEEQEKYWFEGKVMSAQYHHRISSLLSAKDEELNSMLSLLTEDEIDSMTRWAIGKITELDNHSKKDLFKYIRNYYHKIKSNESK